MEIEWIEEDDKIGQVYDSGIMFAFVNKDLKQISPPVYCKDFLQDVIGGLLRKIPVSIYGFKFDYEKGIHPDIKKTRLLVVNRSDKAIGEKIPNCLDFLHQFETKLKLSKTKVIKVTNEPKKYSNRAFIFEGSRRWICSPPMISLYTLLIRVGMVHTTGTNYEDTINGIITGKIKTYQGNDSFQLEDGLPGIQDIIKRSDRKIFGTLNLKNFNQDTHILHNYSGIVAFSNQNAKKYFPGWYHEN